MSQNTIKLVVTADQNKTRLDTFIASNSELSRSRVQQLINEQCILVNEKLVNKASLKLKESQLVLIKIPEAVEMTIDAEDLNLKVVYEDKDVIVINKPSNMVVHPAPGHYAGTLVNGLLFHCNDLSGINGVMRPGIVHRLDKDTTGLIIVAKNDFAHASLSAQLKHRLVSRTYWALVHGHITQRRGIIKTYIGRKPNNRIKMAVLRDKGKEAITRFKVIKEFSKYSLVKLKLETGRTHQIRVHMNYIGHHIVGDELYGLLKDKSFFTDGQWLHAAKLKFIHPRSQKEIEVSCLPPQNRVDLLNQLSAEDSIDIDVESLIKS
ncbi:RluA family pseudouridine synthase [Clostridium sp. 'deep sea']|uniref:RluA family pseudouridine synthase n=1 Tax=Clostridium sp. 'deep sea' TaxID=2779445 RepID=UPI001896532A|nr:RluA family pseudouridine synthase [Clostridium sp. 'deep sea']QOR36202.1 RluA family pseudouridine synthase [Clostridium sp. 'deep sea']